MSAAVRSCTSVSVLNRSIFTLLHLNHTSAKMMVFLDKVEVVNKGTGGHTPKQWPAKFPWAQKKEAEAPLLTPLQGHLFHRDADC